VTSTIETLIDLDSPGNALTFQPMVDVAPRVLHNAEVQWNTFSPEDYWERNYLKLQAEDQEIIRRVSQFFVAACSGRPRARRGIDVGSGTNLYPALLTLPWTDQLLLTDFSASNVRWLRRELADDSFAWRWQPFWDELHGVERYAEIDDPRKHLQVACHSEPGYAGIEPLSVFGLPKARWDLGTMFFVAESITEDPEEFGAAIVGFAEALKPGAPFAAAFMAGSEGYEVADTNFPALPITTDDVQRNFIGLGVGDLSVELLQTKHRVRHGYQAMIVATGFVRDS